MVKNTHTLHGFLSRDRGQRLAYTVLGAGAVFLSLFGLWRGLHSQVTPTPGVVAAIAPQPAPAANPYGPMAVGLGPWARSAAASAPELRPNQETAALEGKVEPAPQQRPAPESVAEAEPSYPEADVPLPPQRPVELRNLASRAELAPMRQAALPAQPAPAAQAPAPGDNRGFFEKLFGGAGAEQQQAAQQPPAPTGRNARRQQQAPVQQAMAYAPQEPTSGGLFSGLTSAVAPAAPAPSVTNGPAPRAGNGTAVYDISAHTVYMPDGTRLEAHSGLREHLDDPRFVHVRMRGPTPPAVYALSPREQLFHGVEALRLTPNSEVYGRAGLLAHTYMLGPNGDSNGCVSFRDYQAFLNAYKRGEVRRLVVVARM
ncbi:DUF2778 domain-containing protein [Methylocystis parvus]|nr:tlde1 domain-containing protein [Methylocystis parvus]WBJ99736.1 DUF2778 domain-containing protein [Methylocystis parvus OBBP]